MWNRKLWKKRLAQGRVLKTWNLSGMLQLSREQFCNSQARQSQP